MISCQRWCKPCRLVPWCLSVAKRLHCRRQPSTRIKEYSQNKLPSVHCLHGFNRFGSRAVGALSDLRQKPYFTLCQSPDYHRLHREKDNISQWHWVGAKATFSHRSLVSEPRHHTWLKKNTWILFENTTSTKIDIIILKSFLLPFKFAFALLGYSNSSPCVMYHFKHTDETSTYFTVISFFNYVQYLLHYRWLEVIAV